MTPPRPALRKATYRLVRYADDFVVLVHGTNAHAEHLRDEAAAVLAPMGLRLSDEKTRICHIDDGFDFLGFRIQRQPKRGSGKPTVYTWPTKKALCTVKAKVRAATRQGLHQPLAVLLYRLAPILRAGPATSATACPRRPSTTCAASPGAGSCDGCAANTATPTGNGSDAATYPDGGQRTVTS